MDGRVGRSDGGGGEKTRHKRRRGRLPLQHGCGRLDVPAPTLAAARLVLVWPVVTGDADGIGDGGRRGRLGQRRARTLTVPRPLRGRPSVATPPPPPGRQAHDAARGQRVHDRDERDQLARARGRVAQHRVRRRQRRRRLSDVRVQRRRDRERRGSRRRRRRRRYRHVNIAVGTTRRRDRRQFGGGTDKTGRRRPENNNDDRTKRRNAARGTTCALFSAGPAAVHERTALFRGLNARRLF